MLLTTAYAPLALLQGWLRTIARVNPVTQVIDAARQGFVGGVSWADTWPGILALAGLLAVLGALALRGMRRTATGRGGGERRGRDRRAGPAPELAEGSATGRRFAYTRPSPGRYPWQWYWDSCFAAIVWRRFDPARSRAELETLLAAQRPDGFIGHTIFWNRPVSLDPPALLQRHLRRASRPRRSSRRCSPGPGGSPSATRPRSRGSPPRSDWLAANRDLDGDGLLWIVQPDESGLDASPKFDPVWGWRAAPARLPAARQRNRRLGFDARRIRERGGPVLCEVSSTRSGGSRCWPWAPLDHAGAGRAALGRATRPVPRRGPAGRRQPPVADLGGARPARPPRPARADRPAPGRGAPARPGAVLDPGRAALGRRPSPATTRAAAAA